VNLAYTTATLKVDSHATTVSHIDLGIQLTKDGNTESLAPTDNSFYASLIMLQSGSPSLPEPGKTASTAPIHMRGSWTGCHTGQ
jgi:hypothetical protein